jgi:Na+-driven multidrug efflux pump
LITNSSLAKSETSAPVPSQIPVMPDVGLATTGTAVPKTRERKFVISSAANSLGTDAMTANAISGQFDGIIYQVGCSIAIACMVMVGQCYGAGDFARIRKTMRCGVGYVTVVSLLLGTVFVLLAEPLLYIMTDNPDVVAIAKDRMTILCFTYFVTSIMEVFSFSLRSLGHAVASMYVGAICGLGFRAAWVFFVWPIFNTLGVLYLAYLPSAALAILIYFVIYIRTLKKHELKIK